MEQTYPVLEFETEVGLDGTIVVPPPLMRAVRRRTVVVRLVQGSLDRSLRGRRVTEDEIERIALLQLESRENVVSFLKTEGTLAANRSFARRAKDGTKRTS